MERLNKKNIFITGASGFIGKNLNEYFVDKCNLFLPSHKELDLLDELATHNYVKNNNINIIIHCANIGGGRDNTAIADLVGTNLRMFFNIAKCSNMVEKIIHFGSGAEYDKSKPIIDVREEDSEINIPKDDYGFYKYICSKYIEKSSNSICLRLFGVYGKYENYLFKFISNTIVKNILHMPIVIKQNVYFDYLFIDDLMRIVDYFIKNNVKKPIYNATRGERIDLLSLANIVNDIGDNKSEISIECKGLNNEYSSNNDALMSEIINFQFTSHQDAIKQLYIWYKDHRQIINEKSIRQDPYINNISIKI